MLPATLSIDALNERFGAAKIARTRAVYKNLSAENYPRVLAGWRRELDKDPTNETLRGIVYLLENER